MRRIGWNVVERIIYINQRTLATSVSYTHLVETCTAKCILIDGLYTLWNDKISRKVVVVTKSSITLSLIHIW